ncbi:cyclin-Q isoform X1 [Schistocerca nitens]|uniref:cyclin-Q isoform X1 n=1 Tax=Schistocerca nitens TaxID=7011 RepID=UPI0021176AB6|nr:cyclin-Q isoform X1 [Schistocerca nitens]
MAFWLGGGGVKRKMKDVIDVMQMQRDKMKPLPVVDYRQSEGTFITVRFIFECGVKLEAQPLTIATAAVLFHRFFKETDSSGYDCYLIAATTLYLAGKVKDDPLKIRDVINVTHNTLHRGSAPLELGDEYWNMRDAIVQAELLIMRMLKFEVTVTHPHKYMLHYLKTLEGWFDKEEWKKVPLVKASAAFLQDFHYDPAVLDYEPQHIAVACINLALQCYGVQVPLTDEGEETPWYSAFVEDLSKEKLWEIMEKLMEVYEADSNVQC